MNKYLLQYIDWIKASDLRKKILKIVTISYGSLFILYLIFFFRLKNLEYQYLEFLGALIFYFLFLSFSLTFKKIRNEK